MDSVKKFVRGVKEVALDYNDVELRTRDATSNDPVGADDRLLSRIAHDTRDRNSYNSMFGVFWKRLTDLHQPSHILKSLILCEYLLINGDDRFVRDMRSKTNVVKRLTAYKYYLNHEDVGAEVRAKSRDVLKLLTEENLIENMRKEQGDRAMANADKRYERNYTPQIQNQYTGGSSSSPMGQQRSSQQFISPPTPKSDSNDERDNFEQGKSSKKTKKAEKKEKKKKKKKERQQSAASFASSLSDEDDEKVEQVTKGLAKTQIAPRPEVDLLTGMGSAPVDWMTAMDFSSASAQKIGLQPPMIESGGATFVGTHIDASTPRGSAQQDGFTFDDALEIGSDDDQPDGNKNLWDDLTDVNNLRAHGSGVPKKAPTKASSSAKPQLTLAQMGNKKETGNEFSIRPLQPQAPQQSVFGMSAPQQFPAQYGYAPGPQAQNPFGFPPQQQQQQYAQQMGYPPQQQFGQQQYPQQFQPPFGQQPYPQQQFQQQPNPAQFQKPTNAAVDPFAELWKTK